MGNCIGPPEKPKVSRLSVLQRESQYCGDLTKIKPERLANGSMLVRTKNATAEVRRLYKVHDFLLGEGAFGKVFLATSVQDETAKYAIKVMPVANLTESILAQMEQEVEVLNKLDHAYVCKYQQSFQDEKYVYIVMHFILG